MLRLGLSALRGVACSSPSVQSTQYQALCACTTRLLSSQAETAADASSIGNEKVQRIADEIVGLTVLECSWLSEILRKRLNLEKPAFGAMPMMPMMGAPAAAAPAAPEPEPVKEKTEFNVKLESFSADGKIKVIKEVRAITSLGLKEAKELVEKAPVVIKSGLNKADAETLKKALETVGGKIVLE